MFFGISKYLLIGMAIMIALFSAYFYYSQNKIERQAEEIVLLRAAQQINEQTIARLEVTIKEMQAQNDAINKEFLRAETCIQYTMKLLGSHDIERLVNRKPGLMEPRINKGTKDLMDFIESMTDPENFDKGVDERC